MRALLVLALLAVPSAPASVFTYVETHEDFVVLCDAVHHLPIGLAANVMAPGGVVKFSFEGACALHT
jgi:hypothetical protein